MKSIKLISAVATVLALAAQAFAGDGMDVPPAKDGSPNAFSMLYLAMFLGATIVIAFKGAKRTRIS